jgi:hypothetical protein
MTSRRLPKIYDYFFLNFLYEADERSCALFFFFFLFLREREREREVVCLLKINEILSRLSYYTKMLTIELI